jgi:prepilin-type N-terminal cleavage/methylation domain-containing protein
MSAGKTRGFSLVEMLIVVSIMLIVMSAAAVQIIPLWKESKAMAALQTTLGQMRRAHEAAVDQRQVYRLTFTAPRTIQLDRVNIDPATGAKTFVFQSTIDLPVETQFTVVAGMPSTTATVPDGFGNGSVAIDFDRDFGGGSKEIYFQRDGRALDAANQLNNGVVYLCRPGELLSCKAVSLIGATGRSKGWRLIDNAGVKKWVQ